MTKEEMETLRNKILRSLADQSAAFEYEYPPIGFWVFRSGVKVAIPWSIQAFDPINIKRVVKMALFLNTTYQTLSLAIKSLKKVKDVLRRCRLRWDENKWPHRGWTKTRHPDTGNHMKSSWGLKDVQSLSHASYQKREKSYVDSDDESGFSISSIWRDVFVPAQKMRGNFQPFFQEQMRYTG